MGTEARTRLGRMIRIGALALVVGVVALLASGPAQAGQADHAHHADHADHAQTKGDDMPTAKDSGPHHGGSCHCISAACTAALPVGAIELTVSVALYQPEAIPVALPPAQRLADPPAKPPRT
ncbi:MAG: hypothetical protein HQL42_07565 [Alphaproteobacteria bacterium]|nr:hypothetical protein [Alphaproteobacteria bacterium]